MNSVFELPASANQKDVLAQPLVDEALKEFQSSAKTFPWALKPAGVDLLNSFGISAHVFGAKSHPHPIHKTVETDLLHTKWSARADRPSTVLYMKPSKFMKMAEGNPNFKCLINQHHIALDLNRYPEGNRGPITTPYAFMHDALMYISPAQIAGLFDASPNLEQLWASIVHPAEATLGFRSFLPDLYQVRTDGARLHYFLEGSTDGAYDQPLSCNGWLTTSGISTTKFQLSVTLVSTHGPFHELLITRQALPAEKTRTFHHPKSLLLPNPHHQELPLAHRLVPSDVHSMLYTYTRAVRTLRTTDPVAVIRTQQSKAEYAWVAPEAWLYLGEFALNTAEESPKLDWRCHRSLLEKIRAFLTTHAPGWLPIPLLAASSALSIKPFLAERLLIFRPGPLTVIRHRGFSAFARQVWRPPKPLLNWMLIKKPRYWFPRFYRSTYTDDGFIQDAFTRARPRTLLCRTLDFACVTAALALTVFALWKVLTHVNQVAVNREMVRTLHPPAYTLTMTTSVPFVEPEPFFKAGLTQQVFPDLVVPKPHEVPQHPSSIYTTTSPSDDEATVGVQSIELPAKPLSLALPPVTPLIEVPDPMLPPRAEPVHESPPRPQSLMQPVAPTDPDPNPHEPMRSLMEVVPEPIDNLKVIPGKLPPLAAKVHEVPNDSNPDGMRNEMRPVRDWNPDLSWWPTGGTALTMRPEGVALERFEGPACLLDALSECTGLSNKSLWQTLSSGYAHHELTDPTTLQYGLTSDHLEYLAARMRWMVHVSTEGSTLTFGPTGGTPIYLIHSGHFEKGHWSAAPSSDFRFGAGIRVRSTLLRSLLQTAPVPFPVTKIRSLRVNASRAKLLLSNMRYGHDGVFSTIHPSPKLDPEAFMQTWSNSISLPRAPVEVVLIQGFAGCGKSYAVSRALRGRKDFVVACPTTHLRDAWKEDLNLALARDTWRSSTWELALTRQSRILVIDEVYKLPPGYLDLALYANRQVEALILLGDPLQGSYHSMDPNSTLSSLAPETERLRHLADIYCFWTRRLNKASARALGVYTTSSEEGSVRHFDICKPEAKMTLAPSIDTAKCLNSLGHHSITCASSQGLTINKNLGVFLDSHTPLMSINVALVAVTRSRRDIIWSGDERVLRQLPSTHPFSVLAFERGNILSSFPTALEGLLILNHPDCLPSSRTIRGGLRARGAPTFDPSFSGDIQVDRRAPVRHSGPPLIPTVDDFFVPESKRFLLQSVEDTSPEPSRASDLGPSSPTAEPVYPGCDYECLRHEYAREEAPLDMERICHGELSNQFPHLNEPFELEVESPSLVAPHHNPRADPTLLMSSLEKRLRFTRERVSTVTPREQIAGKLLYDSYLQAHSLPARGPPFDPNLFSSCISENEYVQLTSKTRAIIIANAGRSDPELDVTMARIFPKSQHKININSLMTAWKACQTLALLHDAVVLLLGPVKKYQRAMLRSSAANDLIFVYGGKSPRDMSEFAKSHFPAGVKRVANDYSAFDQSQRGESTFFEVLKMAYFGLPPEFAEFHMHLKMNLRCQFGRLAPMRFTGEPGTYDDNTDYNLAILNLEYDLAGVPTMISGDDSLLAWLPRTRAEWAVHASFFTLLTWKQEHTLYGEFCGYYASSCGAVRAPRPLLVKLALAKARSELDKTLPSYVAEFAIGHVLGDDLWLALPVSEVPYQAAVFDFICREASPELKVMLKVGEVPEDILARMECDVARPVFALLNAQQRWAYIKAKNPRFMTWALDLREMALEGSPKRLRGGLIAQDISNRDSLTQKPNEMSKPVDHRAPAAAPSLSTAAVPELSSVRPYSVPVASPAASIVAVDQVIAPGLTRPFQHWVHRYAAKDGPEIYTMTMSTLTPIVEMMSIVRVAQLAELSVVIMPHANVVKHACHIDLAWSAAEVVPGKTSICSLPGSRRLVFGGMSALNPVDIACDLTAFNPTLKGPVTYNGTPRLSVTFTGGESPNTLPSIDIYVRGRLHLSYPETSVGQSPS